MDTLSDTFSVRIVSRDAHGGITTVEATLPAAGETLAQAVYLSGRVPAPALCSGLGRCGRCRMRYLADAPPVLARERDVLSHHDLEAGWRLACLRPPAPGIRVALPEETRVPHPPAAPPVSSPVSALVSDGLAVDLGTTSLWWRAGEATGTMTNPQMGAGSDVISRLAYALNPAGRRRLRSLTVDALTTLPAAFPTAPQTWCIAANPAMTCILLDRDVASLARAPYSLDYRGGVWETIPELGRVWIPPPLSPFVGGDVSAGYASLAFDPASPPPAYPFVLADLGTNGELALALSPHEALAASVAMGPALEGINLSFGMEAAPGAVTGYRLTPQGLEPEVLPVTSGLTAPYGATAPRGITGTGYLSLLRALRAAGLLAEDGSFVRPGAAPALPPPLPLIRRLWGAPGTEADHETLETPGGAGEARLRLPGRMYLGAGDVEELLKTKAAFSLALSRLLRAAGLRAADLAAVCITGSLGTHLAPGALGDLGFLPLALVPRIHVVGNSSLAGASLFLRHAPARDAVLAWAERVTTLNLAEDSAFAAAFADHMSFSWHE